MMREENPTSSAMLRVTPSGSESIALIPRLHGERGSLLQSVASQPVIFTVAFMKFLKRLSYYLLDG
jgi:hypothetical protein